MINEINNGMYITVDCGFEKIKFLVDTGAMITVVSSSIFDRISVSEQVNSELQCTDVRLLQANGAPIKVYGEAMISITIGEKMYDCMVIVAEIEQDAILGMDFLHKNNASINCDHMTIQMNGQVIQCTSGGDVTQITAITEDLESVPAHLSQMYEEATANIDKEHHEKIRALLNNHSDVFSQGDHDIGRTTMIQHSIHTTCPAPIRQHPRRPPMGQRGEIEKQVEDMLNRGIITPSSSPWSSPVVLVDKKDGTKRFCVDYRELNKHTIKDSFPLPRIDESIDYLAGAKYFCTLDLAAGYWQVPLDDEAKLKSAFVVPGGLFEFQVMPFGLCNAPSTFQRLMETVLAGLQWKIALIYLDDVIVFGSSVEEVVDRLQVIFTRLREAKLKLKPQKCHLFQREVLYLGHIVSERGVSTDPAKVEVVATWPTPTNVTEVRSFLGLASYYRRFIYKFSDVARPLTALTKKENPFIWTDKCETAFQTLKEKLTTAPILAYPRMGVGFILDTDASQFAIGAVLAQKNEGKEEVTAYGSKTLSPAEQNYCVTRRELLAVVYFLKYFRPYLYGQDVTVRTDHGALTWLLKFKNPEGQLARWLEVISQYKLTIIHRAGRAHSNADGLSRRPCSQCGRLQDFC